MTNDPSTLPHNSGIICSYNCQRYFGKCFQNNFKEVLVVGVGYFLWILVNASNLCDKSHHTFQYCTCYPLVEVLNFVTVMVYAFNPHVTKIDPFYLWHTIPP